ncbi:hypothetical protein E2493_16135 [Sphingomonas parva]|uniref:Uncharacterized protein n=1 Tax=Sphingomonas parva TaxID=2555898 RepID=A0A4Y8ZPP6_9SPHN|nr:hypothetical protein [Sphingomonas parva]TFI57232.1 hypothetical protein E2493_16135 [Sphingomonas parva]
MTDDFEPRQALATATAARQRLAARAASPRWYAPLYGLGTGGIVASVGLPGPWPVAGSVVCLLFVAALYSVWKAKTGLSVNGYRRGRTLPLTLGFLAVILGLAFVAVHFGRDEGKAWVPLACGAVAAIVAAFASAAWDRLWRAEMTEQL